MLKTLLAVTMAMALVPAPHVGAQAKGGPSPAPIYALIVNASNPTKDTGDAAMKTVRTLYLKDLTRWPDGAEARPYGREATSAEHAAFLKTVLGMSEAELARHWLRQKNTNGTTPPKEIDADRLLVKHVARHAGAFGIVKAENAKAAGVRVLFEFQPAQ